MFKSHLYRLTGFAFASILFVLIFYIAVSGYRGAQSLLHPIRFKPSEGLLIDHHIPYQEIELTTSDGIQLSAWYTPPQNGALILLAHGHGSSRLEDYYALFAEHGYGVLAWDFRTHGLSGGDISTLGFNEQLDVEAALAFALAQQEVKHIGAWGGSMGAATMIMSSAKHPEIEVVISDSAYTSFEDITKPNLGLYYPFFIFSWELESGVSANQIRPIDQISKVSPRAVFIIDGWNGGQLSQSFAQRFYDAAIEPKQIWVEKNVPHMGMYQFHRGEYTKRIFEFLDVYLLAHPKR